MYTVTHDTFRTPRGAPVTLYSRSGTNDGAMISAILASDEYQLRGLDLSGWALDIGAHVGSVGMALAIDNPDLNVVMVEPVPDNAALIRSSIGINNLGARVFIEEASAGPPGMATLPCLYDFTSAADSVDTGYLHDTRYVGNVVRGDENPVGTLIDAPVVTIEGLSAKYGVDTWRFAKIDCEGCEYAFLGEGAELIEEMIGEWHDGPFHFIEDVLNATHDVKLIEDKGGIGLFRAVRRG